MSFSSKKTIASILAGILMVIAYIIYALSERAPAPDDLKAWAIAMLIFIGTGIAVVIVIQIAYHISFAIGMAVKEGIRDDKTIRRLFNSETAEDERDKLVSLKAYRINSVFAGFGLLAALVALALGTLSIIALHIIIGSCALGNLIEGIVSIYYYEKGVRNG